MTQLKKYKLRDLLIIKNGCDHKALKEGEYPVYGSGGIMRYVDHFLYDKPSILLPRKGSISNIQYCDTPFWTVDTTYYTVVNEKIANPYYLYRYLTLLDLSAIVTGTGLPSMTFDSYYNIDVELPDLDTQRRIASVLSNLDRKIALNRQINTNLEELARQLYDYWFVQFDFPDANGNPYKSSGGKMTYNEKLKRHIPDGWEVKKLKDCIEHINTGLNPRDNFVFGGDIRYITVKNLTTDGVVDFSNCDYINEEARIKVHRRSQIEVGDILYASICPLGRTYLITSYPKDWDINESVFSIRPNKKIISSEYLDLMLKDDYYIRKLTQSSTGSIFQGIRIHELETTYILVPKIEVINDFSKSVYPLISHKSKMVAEISSLTRQRDELLPLLMNGQVTVK